MKKALNILAIIAFCVIVSIAILFFTDSLQIYLWVKYLLLISALIVLITLYLQFGNRTVFDECIYCLKKAAKGLKRLRFKRSSKIIAIKLINIKNYLAFAYRFLEQLRNDYDLYELKIPASEIQNIKEQMTTNQIEKIQEKQEFYMDVIDNTMKKVIKENQNRKEALIKLKEQRKKELKSKK